MSMRSGISRVLWIATAFIAPVGLTPVAVDARESTAAVTITVFDDRYVEGGEVYDDLDALERQVALVNPRSVVVLVCGAQATRPVKAAVHRFRTLPIQLRVPDLDEQVCLSQASLAKPVRQGAASRPAGIDDLAVNAYWRELMP